MDFEAGVVNTKTEDNDSAALNAVSESSFASAAFESAFEAKFDSKFESVFNTKFDSAYEEKQKKKDYEKKQEIPRDSYSFIALGPSHKIDEKTTRDNRIPLFFGFVVFVFQISLLLLMVLSKTMRTLSNNEDLDNPDQDKSGIFLGSFIPANASVIVRIAQFMVVLASILFGADSFLDLVEGMMYFKMYFEPEYFWVRVSSSLKALQGFLAYAAGFLLVMTSTDVIDIILNFAAVNYISQFDNQAYLLAHAGYYTKTMRVTTEHIKKIKLKATATLKEKTKGRFYLGAVVMITVSSLMPFFILITINGEKSDHWKTRMLRVEFDEENLKQYSGCFKIADDARFYRRMAYQGYLTTQTAALAYCKDDHRWVFHKEGPDVDPCNLNNLDNELAHSSKTYSFDVSTAFDSPWLSSWNKPIAAYFIENDENNVNEDYFFCDQYQNDGKCDINLNNFNYQYDGGDCCAATCSDSKLCGKGNVTFDTAFGQENVTGYGFPSCEDPNLSTVPMLIHLDHIESFNKSFDVSPFLALKCIEDGIEVSSRSDEQFRIFSIPLDENMEDEHNVTYIRTNNDNTVCALQIESDSSEREENYEEGSSWGSVKYNVFLLHSRSETNNWKVGFSTGNTDRKKTFKVYGGYSQDTIGLDTGRLVMNGTVPIEIGDKTTLKDIADVFTFLDNLTLYEKDLTDEDRTEKNAFTTVTELVSHYADIARKMGLFTSLTTLHSDDKNSASTDNIALDDNNTNADEVLRRIPTAIGFLTSLQTINLDSINLSGTIPTEIGELTSLRYLILGNNALTGTIPTEIGLLSSLQNLDLTGNDLTGEIPTQVGGLTSLTTLILKENALIGTIPTEIGLMSYLETVDLAKNKLQGQIPTQIADLANLSKLVLNSESTSLTGTIPTEIEFMTSLRHLDLAGNNLRGEIPTEIRVLTSLKFINLAENNLIGKMPTFTDSKNTSLTDTIPAEIVFMTSLLHLDLKKNQLTGEIPTDIGCLTSLTKLLLNENDLVGTIPTEIASMKSLQHLDLTGNKLRGEMPNEILEMTNLMYFIVGENYLRGNTPKGNKIVEYKLQKYGPFAAS